MNRLCLYAMAALNLEISTTFLELADLNREAGELALRIQWNFEEFGV